ncbi:hypothetical protein [Aneurinibacillus tyrosinisolvens]|uniref:hypothetical protein n=1 Tax=Aneurinibacillus tyrosinisolvens TaxID=1443435 RepID=UPI00063F66D3|nr:hypothetical protein [Aneurinibacillus tyrosinisolvens]
MGTANAWAMVIVCWVTAYAFIRAGIHFTEYKHKETRYTGAELGMGDNVIIYFITGLFFEMIALLLKIMSWKMIKALLIVIGIGFGTLGFIVISHI